MKRFSNRLLLLTTGSFRFELGVQEKESLEFRTKLQIQTST